MFKNLSAGAIGIHGLTLAEVIDLAKQSGFGGIDFDIREAARLADERGIEHVRALFDGAGVRPGQWGLPVAWNKDDQWEQDLEQLPKLAALGRDLGCRRTATWCPAGSNEREFDDNYAWHVARFRPIAEVLKAHDCLLGIEFIGPKTYRSQFKYGFIYTLQGMMELAEDIGTGNVGLLLDAWHLYTSGGSLEDIATIQADDIVTVHVNDAPLGVERDELLDTVRALPMETGVIDLPGFVRALKALDYDGPVTPEPFSQRINAIAQEDPLEAAQVVGEHMSRLWQAAGLT
jgi:sugar phosphate isomerase/epimerase